MNRRPFPSLLVFTLGLFLVSVAMLGLKMDVEATPAEQMVYCESGEEQPAPEMAYAMWKSPCRMLDGRTVHVVMID